MSYTENQLRRRFSLPSTSYKDTREKATQQQSNKNESGQLNEALDVAELPSDVIKSKIPVNTSQIKEITREELRGKELGKLKGRDQNVFEHLLQKNVFDSNTAPRVETVLNIFSANKDANTSGSSSEETDMQVIATVKCNFIEHFLGT